MENTAGLFRTYCDSPWNFVSPKENWWVDCIGFKFPSQNKLVSDFRKALLSFSTREDFWVLRIIAGNHPLVFIDSLPLVLSRAKGVVLPSHPCHPESILDLPDDSPPLSYLSEYEGVLDVLDASKSYLPLCPLHFPGTIQFLVFLLCLAEGKAQRNTMKSVVFQTLGLLCFWVVRHPHMVQTCLEKEFDESETRVTGMFNRLAYYYKESRRAEWIAANWKSPTFSMHHPPQMVEQLRFDQEGYQKAVGNPTAYFSLAMESSLFSVQATASTHWQQIVLLYTYHFPQRFLEVAERLQVKQESLDERTQAFLAAIDKII